MHSECSTGGEIHMRGAGRNSIIREQGSSANVNIRNGFVTGGKVPLQRKGTNTESVCGARALGDQEDRHNVYGVLESSAEETWSSGVGQNPSISKAQVPDPGIRCAAG